MTAASLPSLAESHGEEAPERHASWLELFFDLCFVVAVGAVAATLHHHPSRDGFVTFVALFLPVWWAWMSFAWYAANFAESGAGERFAAFAAMLAILAMAAQVGPAADGDPRGFVLAFAVFHLLIVALFLRAGRVFPQRWPFAVRWVVGFSVAALLWLIALVVPDHLRLWLAAAAFLVDLATPWIAVRAFPHLDYATSQIAERYGLFTLIVLGEAIIAVARGTAESHWTPGAVATAVAGFVVAVIVWWAYFAHEQKALLARGHGWAFIWGYGHVFVWAGIALTGVGIGLAIEAAAAGHGFPLEERLILCGGLALYLAAMALLRAADAGNPGDRIALVRLGAAVLILLAGIFGDALAPPTLTALIAIIAIGAGFAIRMAWPRTATE